MSTHKPTDTKAPVSEGGNGNLSRRDFLLKLSIGLNVVAGAMISIPLIGYVMSSFVKRLPLQWTSLGPLDKFPEGTTRLATYENPYRRPWDGEAAVIPCWVRRRRGRGVSSLRDQLHPSGLSRALVRRVQALHVSVPWRHLL